MHNIHACLAQDKPGPFSPAAPLRKLISKTPNTTYTSPARDTCTIIAFFAPIPSIPPHKCWQHLTLCARLVSTQHARPMILVVPATPKADAKRRGAGAAANLTERSGGLRNKHIMAITLSSLILLNSLGWGWCAEISTLDLIKSGAFILGGLGKLLFITSRRCLSLEMQHVCSTPRLRTGNKVWQQQWQRISSRNLSVKLNPRGE